jgi:hypothetical protein
MKGVFEQIGVLEDCLRDLHASLYFGDDDDLEDSHDKLKAAVTTVSTE